MLTALEKMLLVTRLKGRQANTALVPLGWSPSGCFCCRNKKAISDKYCQRQGEMGVGDCGGLRFIPGATKNGKQKTPEWLAKILGDFKDETRDSNRVEIRNEQKRQLGGD